MSIDLLVNEHYSGGSLLENIKRGLELEGKRLASLSVADLATVDHLHTRGREADIELSGLIKIAPSDLVLDVGCGFGGTARFLADRFNCKVRGIDLTEEFISVGKELNRLVGLESSIELQKASALNLPFEDEEFDVVWTEHVQMNIVEKKKFYSEIARVLKPGGCFLFHDIFLGGGGLPVYPLPWSDDGSLSSLVPALEAREIIEKLGLELKEWRLKDEESLKSLSAVCSVINSGGLPPLGIQLSMGASAGAKLNNYLENLTEARLRVVLGMAEKSK